MKYGRISTGIHPALEALQKSIGFDIRLWPYDIAQNQAHAEMLCDIGILDEDELNQLLDGLQKTEAEFHSGDFEIKPHDVGIHDAIERRVTELAGVVGRKLHTGRSRSDQVATNLRLFCLDAIEGVRWQLLTLIKAFVLVAEENTEVMLPTYSHFQAGQPVLLTHHLLAYVEMFRRDYERLIDVAKRTRVSPLGSVTGVGTNIPIDRAMTAHALFFDELSRNSIDATCDRDFLLELISTLSIAMVHLSRLGEELVLWSSTRFAFIELDLRVTATSQMMPHTRNPDGAELMRGKAGRVFGALMSLLTMLKGLPLAYHKDLLEDHEPLFDSVDTILACLGMANAIIGGMRINSEAMASAIGGDACVADLTERLVLDDGVPLRIAQEIVSTLIHWCEKTNRRVDALSNDDVNAFKKDTGVTLDKAELTTVALATSLSNKDIPGATAPTQVSASLASVNAWIEQTEKRYGEV